MPAGRPPKLTAKIAQEIVTLLRGGNFRLDAAASAGVTPETLRHWLKRGAIGGAKNAFFAAFKRDVDRAEAEANVNEFSLIGFSEDWKAHQFRLSVRNPKLYGTKTRIGIEFENERDELMQLVEKTLGKNALLKLAEAIAVKDAEGKADSESDGTEGDD
jgi:hypothetical protein